MAIRGAKPKPTALKIAQGNPGKRPLNEAEPVYPELGDEPPEFLDEIAKDEWRRIIPMLKAAGVIKAPEAASLAAYCTAFSDFVKATEMMKDKGFLIKSPNGYPMISPLYTIANQAKQTLLRTMSELGLTPSSRSRIHAEPKKEENPLTKLLL